MIRSFNGVRLLSSHLISDASRSIYEGVFDRKLDSGIWTLSRVIGGRGGRSYPKNRLLSNASIRGSGSRRKLPLSHDWRNHEGVLTESRDQGITCTCWTFAITHAIQAALRLYRGISVTLSKQELLDCSFRWKDGSGSLYRGYDYISSYGINLEKVYPYESYRKMRWRPCRKTANHRVFIDGFEQCLINKISLKKALLKRPISVYMCAGIELGEYKKGQIFDHWFATIPHPKIRGKVKRINRVNHAVLLVGYGSKNGMDYWVVQNSWGREWGDDGFFLMKSNLVRDVGFYPTFLNSMSGSTFTNGGNLVVGSSTLPIVGLANGGNLETTSGKQRGSRVKNTPGSGEALLRGQVKTLMQMVEEEALEILAPTSQIQNLSGTATSVVQQQSISQVVNMDQDIGDFGKCEITKSLDFSEKFQVSEECNSEVTQGRVVGRCSIGDDGASIWSMQVNSSKYDEDDVEEEIVEEEEDYYDVEDEEYEGLDELCEGLNNIEVNEKVVPKFAGKHTRFVYNSDDEIVKEEEDESVNADSWITNTKRETSSFF